MESIIKLTDAAENKTIEISVGLDQAQLNLASPAHLTAVWIVNNFQTIVEQAGNDRSKLIAAIAASVPEGGLVIDKDAVQPEDANGGGSGEGSSQKSALDQIGFEAQPGMSAPGSSH